MRRLENDDEGKFWEAWIKDDVVFYYRYGKIGSAGHLKLKKFDTRAEAEAELEEKLAEKLEQGFVEPGAEDEEAAGDTGGEGGEESDDDGSDEEEEDSGEDAEDEHDDGEDEDEDVDDEDEDVDEEDEAESPHELEAPSPQAAKPTLHARMRARSASSEDTAAAIGALHALAEGAGGRSWKVGRLARRARRALARLGAADFSTLGPVTEALDAVTGRVIAPDRRLPLDDVLSVLWVVDAATYATTVRRWRARMLDSPAAASIGVLAATFDGVADGEVAVHVAAALVDRRVPRDAFRRWFRRLRPFLAEALAAQGSSVERFAATLKADRDAVLGSRIGEVAA